MSISVLRNLVSQVNSEFQSYIEDARFVNLPCWRRSLDFTARGPLRTGPAAHLPAPVKPFAPPQEIPLPPDFLAALLLLTLIKRHTQRVHHIQLLNLENTIKINKSSAQFITHILKVQASYIKIKDLMDIDETHLNRLEIHIPVI